MTGGEKPRFRVYRGGVRWRRINATWPLAKLSISRAGIEVRSAFRFRLLRVPELDLAWSEIDRVEAVRGWLPFSYGGVVHNQWQAPNLVGWILA